MKNKRTREALPAHLRAQLAPWSGSAQRTPRTPEDTLSASPDLHDLYAETPADAPAVNAFGMALAIRATGRRPIIWALDRMTAMEIGSPYGSGLADMGVSPDDVFLVQVPDVSTLLLVGEEAVRSRAARAVLLSAWGESRAFSLSASRRLALAARASATPLLLARAAAVAAPSPAETRWLVRSTASTPLEGDAPGRPAFSLTLARSRRGGPPLTWIMEWDRERRSFVEPTPVSGGLVSLASQRSAGPRTVEAGRSRAA